MAGSSELRPAGVTVQLPSGARFTATYSHASSNKMHRLGGSGWAEAAHALGLLPGQHILTLRRGEATAAAAADGCLPALPVVLASATKLPMPLAAAANGDAATAAAGGAAAAAGGAAGGAACSPSPLPGHKRAADEAGLLCSPKRQKYVDVMMAAAAGQQQAAQQTPEAAQGAGGPTGQRQQQQQQQQLLQAQQVQASAIKQEPGQQQDAQPQHHPCQQQPAAAPAAAAAPPPPKPAPQAALPPAASTAPPVPAAPGPAAQQHSTPCLAGLDPFELYKHMKPAVRVCGLPGALRLHTPAACKGWSSECHAGSPIAPCSSPRIFPPLLAF